MSPQNGKLSATLVGHWVVLIDTSIWSMGSNEAVLIASISDDNRATNPSSTQEAIAQVLCHLPPGESTLFVYYIVLLTFTSLPSPCDASYPDR
jgi:hypothetical protein